MSFAHRSICISSILHFWLPYLCIWFVELFLCHLWRLATRRGATGQLHFTPGNDAHTGTRFMQMRHFCHDCSCHVGWCSEKSGVKYHSCDRFARKPCHGNCGFLAQHQFVLFNGVLALLECWGVEASQGWDELVRLVLCGRKTVP